MSATSKIYIKQTHPIYLKIKANSVFIYDILSNKKILNNCLNNKL